MQVDVNADKANQPQHVQTLMNAFKLPAQLAEDMFGIAAAQGRPASEEVFVQSAAFVLLSERRHLLLLLTHLLYMFLGYSDAEPAALHHVTKLLKALVAPQDGQPSVLSRLCSIAQVRYNSMVVPENAVAQQVAAIGKSALAHLHVTKLSHMACGQVRAQ